MPELLSMTREEIQAVFILWREEWIADGSQPMLTYDEDYPEEAAGYFGELLEKVRGTPEPPPA